ncbi:kinase-like protein [Glonium stellatum]|uniref:Kinase-like protein n=1 Tax=Glonium stellatum TaxID=574774 RepID=A0A8E2JSY2_9PEZI|nr:kinase-like protein [Glonium stellatum]
MVEVEHLHHLRHIHIVQLVGTYLHRSNFAILLYPCADYNLTTFLEDTFDLGHLSSSSGQWLERAAFLGSSFGCLTHALEYIHARSTKHMDIKSANILVKEIPATLRKSRCHKFRIYIADFGLSRSFASVGHSQSDGPTSRTPKYCAPEVYNFDMRGRSADVFSLRCVYLEILTVLSGQSLDDFAAYRRGDNSDGSFHKNLIRVNKWFDYLLKWPFFADPKAYGFIRPMISEAPTERPTATRLAEFLRNSSISSSMFESRTMLF